MPEPLVDAITGHLEDIIQESKALRGDVRQAERARRKAAAFNLAVLVVLAVALLAVGALGWQNNKLAQRQDETNRRIADCSTPGGRCYEEGRTRTSGAIAAVVRISVYVSQCGRLYPGESGPEYDKKLDACVAAKLAAATPGPTPPR